MICLNIQSSVEILLPEKEIPITLWIKKGERKNSNYNFKNN